MATKIYTTVLILLCFNLSSIFHGVHAQLSSCSTTDGSKANSIDCACGTTDCTAATGRKCIVSFDLCMSGFVPGDVTLYGSSLLPLFMGKYEWSGSNLNGKPTYKYNLTNFLE